MTAESEALAAQQLYAAGYRRGHEDAAAQIAELEAENTRLADRYAEFQDLVLPFLSESVKARIAEIRAALEAQQ